tara:strand:- start:175 stop:678 length:504 start_codon:yes stop_codon:yes gene_type:complete
MNSAEQLAAMKRGQYSTRSTAVAASLAACGVKLDKDKPCSNTYTKERPYKAGEPGIVQFHMDIASDTFRKANGKPLRTEHLVDAWNSQDANEKLDALIAKIEDEELKAQIEEQLPKAIMSHHRAAFGNFNMMRKWWRKVEPWVFIRRGKKQFLLPRNSKKTKKAWNL